VSMTVAPITFRDDQESGSSRVAVAKADQAVYPSDAPYHPDQHFPEYPFGAAGISPAPNAAYAAVREAFRLFGLDPRRYGRPDWNPLGDIIRPGNRVVIKPNFVLHHNQSGHGLEPMVTHPAVLRAVADYAFIALKGEGSLTIADAPQADCDFHALSNWTRLGAVQEFYRQAGLRLDVIDLRRLRVSPRPDGYILSSGRTLLEGDPLGYVTVDLGRHSRLNDLPNIQRLYGSDYDRSYTVRHHSCDRHEYLIARTILSSDVIINVPKMKVHKKVGVTLNIKNLVGINGDKNYLAHYRIGSPCEGGDAYPDDMDARGKRVVALRTWLMERLLTRGSRVADILYVALHRVYRLARNLLGIRVDAPIEAGNWHGNDTCWRMSLDLNHILFFADVDGRIHDTPQRRFFSVVDGIIGGQENGPLAPSPIPSGVIAVGDDPWAVDAAVTRLMGFDWRKIPQLAAYHGPPDQPRVAHGLQQDTPRHLQVLSEDDDIRSMMTHCRPINTPFRPHPGWLGHIELSPVAISPARRTAA